MHPRKLGPLCVNMYANMVKVNCSHHLKREELKQSYPIISRASVYEWTVVSGSRDTLPPEYKPQFQGAPVTSERPAWARTDRYKHKKHKLNCKCYLSKPWNHVKKTPCQAINKKSRLGASRLPLLNLHYFSYMLDYSVRYTIPILDPKN